MLSLVSLSGRDIFRLKREQRYRYRIFDGCSRGTLPRNPHSFNLWAHYEKWMANYGLVAPPLEYCGRSACCAVPAGPFCYRRQDVR